MNSFLAQSRKGRREENSSPADSAPPHDPSGSHYDLDKISMSIWSVGKRINTRLTWIAILLAIIALGQFLHRK
jgi:hypothetical protein